MNILCRNQLILNIPDPLGDGTVLLLLLGELALNAEGLESGHDLLERKWIHKICLIIQTNPRNTDLHDLKTVTTTCTAL